MCLSIKYGGYNLAFKIYNIKTSQSIFLIAKPISSYTPPICTGCAGQLSTHCSPSTLSPAFTLSPAIAFVWVVLFYTFISIIYNHPSRWQAHLSSLYCFPSLTMPTQTDLTKKALLLQECLLLKVAGCVCVRWGSYPLPNKTINFLKGRYP